MINMAIIYTSDTLNIKGGPSVWTSRFEKKLNERGFLITHNLDDDWKAALFVIETDKIRVAKNQSNTVAYRVAGGYLPAWFNTLERPMRSGHYLANAGIALALDIADHVIYQSHWAYQTINENIYQRTQSYSVIYNGVDLESFSPPQNKDRRIPVLATVGRFRYKYRLNTFFQMSRILDFPHKLLVVGEVDDDNQRELDLAFKDSALNSRLTYQPYVQPGELPKYYRQMDLLIHPVCGDACPNVVVESLACGVPVVAPKFGGTAELIGSGGILFDCQPWVYDQKFIASMGEAVTKVIPELESLSSYARLSAQEKLDINKMMDSYLNALGLPEQSIRMDFNSRESAGEEKKNIREKASRIISKPRYFASLAFRKSAQFYVQLAPKPSNKKPKIAFTLPDFYIGGIESWLYRLALALKDDYEFHFLATRTPTSLQHFSQIGHFEYLPNPLKMMMYLAKNNIDIVQVHNERWPIDAALAAGVKHIIERLGGRRSWLRVPKYGLDLIIASSEMGKKTVVDAFPGCEVVVIYNGVDLDTVDSAPTERLFPKEDLVLGRVSRFGRGQNLELLIRAVDRLKVRIPNLRLVLVGADSLLPGAEAVESSLHQLVSDLMIHNKVLFTGMIENPIPYIKGFDIATCVSKDEGIPNSLIESMACGQPVISTNVGAISELVIDKINGLLVPSSNLNALCKAVLELSEKPWLRQEYGESGRKTIEEKFLLKNSAAKYSSIYHKLMEKS